MMKRTILANSSQRKERAIAESYLLKRLEISDICFTFLRPSVIIAQFLLSFTRHTKDFSLWDHAWQTFPSQFNCHIAKVKRLFVFWGKNCHRPAADVSAENLFFAKLLFPTVFCWTHVFFWYSCQRTTVKFNLKYKLIKTVSVANRSMALINGIKDVLLVLLKLIFFTL